MDIHERRRQSAAALKEQKVRAMEESERIEIERRENLEQLHHHLQAVDSLGCNPMDPSIDVLRDAVLFILERIKENG